MDAPDKRLRLQIDRIRSEIFQQPTKSRSKILEFIQVIEFLNSLLYERHSLAPICLPEALLMF